MRQKLLNCLFDQKNAAEQGENNAENPKYSLGFRHSPSTHIFENADGGFVAVAFDVVEDFKRLHYELTDTLISTEMNCAA